MTEEEKKELEQRIYTVEKLLKANYEPGSNGDYLKKQLLFVKETMFLLYHAEEEDVVNFLNLKNKNIR